MPAGSPSCWRGRATVSRKGQPLFVIEAADTVQAQNDFITAMTALNKAKSALDLAQIQDKRAKDLFEGKAVPLKDYQQAQATLIQAQNDLRSSQTALEAARNKLRILGLTDEAISSFQEKGSINPNTTIFSPIAGTVVQRKIGPGQYVNCRRQRSGVRDRRSLHGLAHGLRARDRCRRRSRSGRRSPSTCWRCRAATLTARINYVAAAIDPATRRLLVRATSTTRTAC